jgi:hypothetical protein
MLLQKPQLPELGPKDVMLLVEAIYLNYSDRLVLLAIQHDAFRNLSSFYRFFTVRSLK